VPTLAKLAHDAGISNIVCSPQEIGIVRSATPTARIITPGIRGPEDAADDQRRTLSAREAIDAGAGLLVIGRPITKAPHPGEALEKIIASLS
jgi:orotidine-5'-phosphate decarboxylase